MSDTEQSTDEVEVEVVAVAALPGDGLREGIVEELRRHLGDDVVDVELRPQDDLWVRVRTDAWERTGRAVHAMGFHYFCFLSGLDWLPSPWGRGEDDPTEPPPERSTAVVQGVTGGDTRFQLLARVVDVRRHVGLTLKVDVPDDAMAVASWHAVYAGADWHERETHEMFGIGFDGHPDLRNMYLPTDFEGHPLRKDFPLLARMVKPWPGIVDVEPMPTPDEDEAEAPKTEDAPEAGEPASSDATDLSTSVSADTTETVAPTDTNAKDSPETAVDPGDVTGATESDAPAHEEPSPELAPDESASADELDSGQESQANTSDDPPTLAESDLVTDTESTEEAPKTKEAPEAGETASSDVTEPSPTSVSENTTETVTSAHTDTEDEFVSDVEPSSGQESDTNEPDEGDPS